MSVKYVRVPPWEAWLVCQHYHAPGVIQAHFHSFIIGQNVLYIERYLAILILILIAKHYRFLAAKILFGVQTGFYFQIIPSPAKSQSNAQAA